jgi:hypothetical protein
LLSVQVIMIVRFRMRGEAGPVKIQDAQVICVESNVVILPWTRIGAMRGRPEQRSLGTRRLTMFAARLGMTERDTFA